MEFEVFLDESSLKKLPLAFRFMIRRESETIGELYKHVRFSPSGLHQIQQYSNYPCYKPLSTIIVNEDYEQDHL